MRKHKIIIVGLGGIGAKYDFPSITNSYSRTHASALMKMSEFQIVAGVDSNPEARQQFEENYFIPTLSSISEINGTVDGIVIATPTQLHFKSFKDAISLAPKFILCEKPIAETYDEAKQMENIANDNKILLLVNYIRRFDPAFRTAREHILSGLIGKITSARVTYSRGSLNTASHAIDLLNGWIGPFEPGNRISEASRFRNNDYSFSFYLKGNNFILNCVSIGHDDYSFLDIELFGERGRILIDQEATRIQFFQSANNPEFKELSSKLLLPSNVYEFDSKHYQLNVWREILKEISYPTEDNILFRNGSDVIHLVQESFKNYAP